jgi:hypothetical protein
MKNFHIKVALFIILSSLSLLLIGIYTNFNNLFFNILLFALVPSIYLIVNITTDRIIDYICRKSKK